MTTNARVGFNALDDETQMYWADQAKAFLYAQKWTYSAKSFEELVYGTAVYLYEMSKYVRPDVTFPHYVTHSQDSDARFVCESHNDAFRLFKKLKAVGHRVGLFHWSDPTRCQRVYASPGYGLEMDYPGIR